MDFSQLLDLILHVDKALGDLLQLYGPAVYALLFAIVFAETGLVVFPFLPGDTLLFIGGAFCANGAMNAPLLIVLLVVAAVMGVTALTGFCPLYALFGISTCPVRSTEKPAQHRVGTAS